MIPACYPVPPARPGFAPSRLAAHVNEVLAVWWATGPDRVFVAPPSRPWASRTLAVILRRHHAPGLEGRAGAAEGDTSAASRTGGGPAAAGRGLDLSPGHFGTQQARAAA